MEDAEFGGTYTGAEGNAQERQVICDYCETQITLGRTELEQGWYVCPECGELTHLGAPEDAEADEALEFAPRTEDVEWVQVSEVSGPSQASLLIAYLRANGLEAYAWQEGVGRALGLSVGPLAVSHIVVPEAQAAEARTLLAPEATVCPNCEAELELDETEQAQGWYRCPECGEVTHLDAA